LKVKTLNNSQTDPSLKPTFVKEKGNLHSKEKESDLFSGIEEGLRNLCLERSLSKFLLSNFSLIPHRRMIDLSQDVPHNGFLSSR